MRKLGLAAAGAGLFLVGFVLFRASQLSEPIIPQTAGPAPPASHHSGGHVVADDETPSSPPYRTIGHAPSAPPAQQLAIPTSFKPLAKMSNPKISAPEQPVRFVMINNKQYPLRIYRPLLAPNDPLAAQAWVTNAILNQAWDIPAGSHETVLAIIDTGFGLDHEEFDNRWYTNPGESGPATEEEPSLLNCTDRGLTLDASCNLIDDDSDGIVDNESGPVVYQNPSRLNCSDQGKPLTRGCNRIDDDGNGLIDDVNGWDFVNNDNSVQAGELNPSGSGTTHGTRVAAVAAATGNNSLGIAGVDWQTKILPIQALDDDSYGDTLGVGRAILYAAAQGADVISLSLGSYFPDDYVREAIQVATASGSVVVASSGNDGCDCMAYPANYPEVVAVGALAANNQPANFSSYGANLDLLAPGTGITTASWSSGNPTSAYAGPVQGTSFAAPIVSGLLTRMLSSRPEATPLQLIAAITENTNRLTLPATASRSPQLGYGAADGFRASSRMVAANNSPHLYNLTPVSKGAHLAPSNPAEPPGSFMVQQCEGNLPGTTPLYELIRGSSHFFSISQTEVWLAQKAGYTTQLFAEACLQQPHDVPALVRPINLFREFRNIYTGH